MKIAFSWFIGIVVTLFSIFFTEFVAVEIFGFVIGGLDALGQDARTEIGTFLNFFGVYLGYRAGRFVHSGQASGGIDRSERLAMGTIFGCYLVYAVLVDFSWNILESRGIFTVKGYILVFIHGPILVAVAVVGFKVFKRLSK